MLCSLRPVLRGLKTTSTGNSKTCVSAADVCHPRRRRRRLARRRRRNRRHRRLRRHTATLTQPSAAVA